MEVKEKLVSRLKDLLKKDDFESAKPEIDKTIDEFKLFVEEDRKKKLAAFVADGDKPEFFEMPIDEFDRSFEEYRLRYLGIVKAIREDKIKAEDKNHEKKLGLLNELQEVIENEDVIAKAFNSFNSIQDRWKAIGNVPSNKFRELQHEYRKKIEEFYYHINIYKELKANDLKRNLGLKQGLIDRMTKLTEETNIKEIEKLHKAIHDEWDEIGPTFKENWEEIRDKFYDLSHQLSGKVRGHYQDIKERQKNNLKSKIALIEKVKTYLEKEYKSVSDWNKATDKVKAIQNEWKSVGFAPKKHNDAVWKEFKEIGNEFFEKKSAFFKSIKSEQKDFKEAKEKLIEKLKEITDVDLNDESLDWKGRTQLVVNLQKKWKNIGAASRHDEQKLWKKFRAICDGFFKSKDQFFKGKDQRQKDNLKAKKATIQKVRKWKASGDESKDLASLEAFSQEWSKAGFVPNEAKEKISREFADALNVAYGQLNMDEAKQIEFSFKGKIKQLLAQKDPLKALELEKRKIRDRKTKMNDQKVQMETNLAFFSSSKGDNPLLKDAKAKIEGTIKIMEELDLKTKFLNVEMNRIKKQEACASAEASGDTQKKVTEEGEE
ncbi:MAG: hypothetical protein CL840_22200 [Crocinitomicaceae bacterium]|nr:hypothetical protein [Crocinitomicaceae bacterium]|tara:strand:- start:20779 stop:22584 length:1806 start_codon:yes stop_codon:yes gene_type:complete